MRVFLFISKAGDALPLAQRVRDEGHRVLFYINEKDKRRIGEGLIEKSPAKDIVISDTGVIDQSALREVLYPKPDCIIFDMVGEGYGKLADQLRKQKYPVIGGSLFSDRVELDRPYGTRILKMSGINTPKTYAFSDYKEAIKFVEDTNLPYVYKPSGNQPTTTTYVSQGADDLIGVLEYYSDIDEEFELQEKVEGIEISTELWFNGTDVVSVNHTMEEKELMEGGIGPKTGDMGSVVWEGSQDSRLFKEGIGKLTPALKKVGFRGPIDLNTIVNKDTIYGLELTPRFGYNAIFALLELYRGKVNDLFYGFASGVSKHLSLRPRHWAIALTFCVEPYPIDEAPEFSRDLLIQGVSQPSLKHIWFYDVYKKGDKLACSGNGGNLGAITAGGESLREAQRRAYRTLSNLVVPGLMYRRDIGKRVESDINRLRSWKWLA